MITTRRAVLGGAAAAFLAKPARAQARPGYLRFGMSAYPTNLQPWLAFGATAGMVKLLIHRSLLGYDRQGGLQGELAESWSLDPDGAWVFKLRQGAVFHNGDPVTADDVKWSLEQIADAHSVAYMKAQFQELARIEVPDQRTIRLVTKTPQATLPGWFANYNMFIISRKSDAATAIGAGPFILAGQERGVSLDITAFDKYYKPGLPKLKRITFINYADENARVAALRSGDLDMIEYVPYQSMDTLAADPRLKLDEVRTAGFIDILFNGSRPPFSDPRVRQAVAHAVKRNDVVQAAFFGHGSALDGIPIAEGTPFYVESLAHGWNYDPARARALLAAAGYPDGFQTTLLATTTYSMHQASAVVVQQYLAQIGVQCELILPDWGTRVALGVRGQYDMSIQGGNADSNDPDGLSVLMDTSLSPAHTRSFGLSAPRTTAALARGRAEYDLARRIEIYREMQVAALEEVPLVGLAWRAQAYGMDKRVTGFTNLPGALSVASGGMLEETAFG